MTTDRPSGLLTAPTAEALRGRLATSLRASQRERLRQVAHLAAERGWPLYIVGGFVRDLLLGLSPDDFDLVVEGDAPALARAAAGLGGGEVRVHAPFGTATWATADGETIDFATARTERYPQPAALPIIQAPATIRADLDRRDFALNAMALRLDDPHLGELVDPHGGLADLAERRVRVLHPLSFRDDPTRIFRAVRYEQRLQGRIAPETLALLPEASPALAALSADRVRHEFERIVREPHASLMLARLAELGVLPQVHAGLAWSAAETADAAVLTHWPPGAWRLAAPPEPEARYLALLLRRAAPPVVAAAVERLNLGRVVGLAVREAVALRRAWACPSEAVAALDALSELGVLAGYAAQPELRADLDAYLGRWRFVRPTLTGDDLIARGLTPGPHFRELLWALRAAWLDGAVTDTASEADWLVNRLAGRPQP